MRDRLVSPIVQLTNIPVWFGPFGHSALATCEAAATACEKGKKVTCHALKHISLDEYLEIEFGRDFGIGCRVV